MSLSSAPAPETLCGNCGMQREATDFRCSKCGRLLSAMLKNPVYTGATHRTRSHSGAVSGGKASELNLVKRLFTAQGRLGRLQYFLANLILTGVLTLLSFVVLIPMMNSFTQAALDMQLNPDAAAAGFSFGPFILTGLLVLGVSLFSTWSFCCLASQRSHDLGLPGTYCLFSFVPLLNLYWALRWWFSPGQVGANTYGPDPLG